MARRIIEEITSDLSGEPDARTITFVWESKEYEVDLTEEEIERVRSVLIPVLEVSRPLHEEIIRSSFQGLRCAVACLWTTSKPH